MEAPPDATQMTRTMATEEPRVDSQPLAAQVDTAAAPATPQ
jgi:hypothetical protein